MQEKCGEKLVASAPSEGATMIFLELKDVQILWELVKVVVANAKQFGQQFVITIQTWCPAIPPLGRFCSG